MRHPWFQNKSAVLGFEARGTYGPAYMFETSYQYGALLRELKASGAPVIDK